ncbi:MAG: hypothetical protein AB4038_01735 [Prochloraceae cyanobacterium]
MDITLQEKLKSLPRDRQEKIASRAKELIQEEYTRRKISKQPQVTQKHQA